MSLGEIGFFGCRYVVPRIDVEDIGNEVWDIGHYVIVPNTVIWIIFEHYSADINCNVSMIIAREEDLKICKLLMRRSLILDSQYNCSSKPDPGERHRIQCHAL